jgi:hypothetical protein
MHTRVLINTLCNVIEAECNQSNFFTFHALQFCDNDNLTFTLQKSLKVKLLEIHHFINY